MSRYALELDQAEVKKYCDANLIYEKETGKIFRKLRTKAYINKYDGLYEIKNLHSGGYNRIPIKYKGGDFKIYHHRLVLFFETGKLPDPQKEIDHINGNKLDNRFSNLRLVDRRLNTLNSKHRRNNGLYSIAVISDTRKDYSIKRKYQVSFPQFLTPFKKQVTIGYCSNVEQAKEMLCSNVSEWLGFNVTYEDFLNREFLWPSI